MSGWALGSWGLSPWGGVVHPAPSSPSSQAGQVEALGIIEATTGAIAESDNEIGGFVMTRLTSAHVAGSAVLNVESTLGWPDAGKIGLGGIVYYYTGRTLTTLTGITHVASGAVVAGTAVDHRVDSAVIEVSLKLSALEQLRRSFLVRYAAEEDLNVIGRNLGVNRLPIFGDDDQYRDLIQRLAYCPKGTVQGLELAMEGLVGAGNYEIYEDPIMHHNTVFIKIASSILLSSVSVGKFYLTGHAWNTLSGSQDTLTLAAAPISVQSVTLKDLGEEFDFRNAIPSAVTYPYWEGETPANAFSYQGSIAEGTGVTQVPGFYTKFKASGAPGTVFYQMADIQGARIAPESHVEFSVLMMIPTGAALTAGKLLQASVELIDDTRYIRAGLENDMSFGLFATEGGGHLGNTVTLAYDQFYDVLIKKFADERVELWVDGQLIDTQDYTAFGTGSSYHQFNFGLMGTPAQNMEAWFKQVNIQIINTRDYWSARETGTGTVNATNPKRLTLSGSSHTFVSSDVGKGLLISGSAATNPSGGNNNGLWVIDSLVSGAAVELVGRVNNGAEVSTTNPKRITVSEMNAFKYPDDLGKEIIISGSGAGNDGTYIIEKLLEPGSLTDFASFLTPNEEYTNICEVVAATFITETDLSWQLRPVFVTETGLDWVQADAGSIAGAVLTLRQALWVNGLVMEIGLSDVLTGQLLEGAEEHNVIIDPGPPVQYKYYPIYLYDQLGAIEAFLDALTVAGVIPEVLML